MKRLNIKLQYPFSIYIVISIYSLVAFFLIDYIIKSSKLNYTLIEYSLVTILLMVLKLKTIRYRTKRKNTNEFGFAFPVTIIYGVIPVIISNIFYIVINPEKKPLIKRYFTFLFQTIAAGTSFLIFTYLLQFTYGRDILIAIIIIISATVYAILQVVSISLIVYLEHKERLNTRFLNIFETNVMNGLITYYLFLTLGIYGLFISILYALLFSIKSNYVIKYHDVNQELTSFESEFYKINSELYEVEQRLRLIFDTIDYGIIVFDLDKRVKMANPISTKFLNEFVTDPIGKKVFDLNIDYPKDVYNIIEWTILNKENYYQKKLAVPIKDDIIYFDIYTYPYRIAEGIMDGVILLYKNVTEEHLIRRQLVEADKLSHMGQIAAGKVHEIKNPLTTVRGYIQFLQQKVAKGDTINLDHFDIALQELDRTNELINSLLILSKHSDQKLENLELNTLLQEIIQLFLHQMQMKNIYFAQEIEKELYIFGVENHLKQIFINLILNAIDAVSKKSAEAVITLRAYRNKNMVIVELEDNGVGISPINIERLHIPFFTTKETGTGLGLSVTFKLVEEHSGIINVYSKLNEGTKFVIKFPAND